ncbi:MAG: 2,3-bisphosphoglycerate-independent phosphoglycerate mutase [Cyanobacteria bacterium]|nr:2,3-bisphosphoglycerate-independent phosphoglycerate mutase [Cyanobacteriota bacterium]
MTKTPLLLLIFDGWGLAPTVKATHKEAPQIQGDLESTIDRVHPAHYFSLLADYPWLPLQASGLSVGLPEGQMGNSEVGHMTMGAGRIIYQELTRIDHEIATGSFETNKVLNAAIDHAQTTGGTLHLMGLLSDGGVHSHINHLKALISMALKKGQTKIAVHAFLDGRDTPQKSAEVYLDEIEAFLSERELPQIQTISGRYYAMDRDKRWDRVEKAYTNLTAASGRRFPFSVNALQFAYHQHLTDEFVLPSVTDLTYEGMQDGDSIIFYNFRPDRARELTEALTQETFEGFERPKMIKNLYFACMCLFDERFHLPIAFEKQRLDNILPQIVSEHGLTQFRTAETEKYAHVTFFFNGGFETPYPGETRELVASPKVATYDLQPEMSLPAVCDVLVAAIESRQYDVLVANFANPDMVGHTGIVDAAESAIHAVDKALGRVMTAVHETNGIMLLTADHGNIETMIDPEGNPHTAHTTNPVPLVLVSQNPEFSLQASQGETPGLSNIAPTMLDLLHIPIPKEMTAHSLLVRNKVPV